MTNPLRSEPRGSRVSKRAPKVSKNGRLSTRQQRTHKVRVEPKMVEIDAFGSSNTEETRATNHLAIDQFEAEKKESFGGKRVFES
ncbi:hypothetical protein L596_008551 [Steinernema carpocapsae]|uniref:Uncharacterized protein n=1 Tax=Steinernema carpocapsae TaxID=34508 RepID=A0A4U5PCU3_STECR|nr:hypothetical protein L596_008551 [Steinernema carpocapsae]